ncbi:LacI family DNA-binding transcriptional regulator [Vagococcus carniphilus]|uniref:LacI family DNA-binding transcriptional regulator n=1 Tax=Vagococcus carniphilus TaxID=218144 RepID=A0AAW8U2X5_9ENTE|nr:LacI family DNA-binding transcriptional regulator [Vagococcus carniphilus]MDT2831446.1 LacI family DNA-binding transcriptional regulator [Vagococcus carniphilus]MDT2832669.1 LacI family DNA-binding transcriptional regulator [Vagococcus carniphilus]MDT2840168.1 LacI family DNA-binding transcriptional regulator [Vagococcus carniphilus]MDT2849520.1 LacI family DNA-binding transcriptional regulator [Vagococcus carniphilus]MDT2855009.1 LacI family DNA-binding transcriptional regulator [Vagococcu
MTTLSDVAKKANVSKMTVSRVINHPEKVTDELKELVFQAMKDLDYKPNVAAKALANNRTQVIKFFILEEIDTTEPYYMTLLMGMSKELDKHQYSLQLVTENSFDVGQSDGYVITGMREEDYPWIERLEKPFVLFGENRYGYDFVDTDNAKGTEISTEHAIKTGFEKIVYVGIDVKEPFEFSRESGYINTMQRYQKVPEIVRFSNRSRYSERFIEEQFARYPKKTAFVCSSDRLAIGIERGLQKCKASIPDDYGVVGFDGVFLDQIASPRLTTVKQPVFEMGAACATMLLNKIKQKGAPQGNQLFEASLVVRGSTQKD